MSSTTTLESTIIAEIESKQIPSTPRQVRDKMVEAVNAANGLRYEIARFGDIEQQLKALQQKTEPLVLRAKELSDLVCQHMSSPRANSRIHEMEELLQKVQQLERENAELRKDVYQCPPTSENDYEGLKWSDAFDVIEGDNSKLHNEVTALKHENIALREARKPVAVPGLHGVVTWYADAQQLGEAFQREREKCLKFEEVMQSQGDEIRRLTVESDALRNEMASLKHQTQWECICGGTDCEGQKENAELREDRELLNFLLNRGVCWRGCDKELEGEYWTVGHETEWLYGLDRGRERIRAAIDAARKEGQP